MTAKDRPIIFSAPMVRAIIDGRKTQTRRIIKPQPNIDRFGNFCWNGSNFGQSFNGPNINAIASPLPSSKTKRVHCPYGKPGDRLYVKEAAWMWCERKPNGTTKTGKQKWFYAPLVSAPVFYCADHPDKPKLNISHQNTGNEWGWRKKVGRFLPRWASRILLDKTNVRVERLNDISTDDAIAEGLKALTKDGSLIKYGIPDLDGHPGNDNHGWHWRHWDADPKRAFRKLWESINGQESWDLNLFVWAIEFKIVEIKR